MAGSQVMNPSDAVCRGALCCASMQELPKSNDNGADTQAAELAACSGFLVFACACVLGCELLQGLTSLGGDAPPSIRTEAQ